MSTTTTHFDTGGGNQLHLPATQPQQAGRKRRCKRNSTNSTNSTVCDNNTADNSFHASSQQLSQLTNESIDIINSIAAGDQPEYHSHADKIESLTEHAGSFFISNRRATRAYH
jgi:hypothetical protein